MSDDRRTEIPPEVEPERLEDAPEAGRKGGRLLPITEPIRISQQYVVDWARALGAGVLGLAVGWYVLYVAAPATGLPKLDLTRMVGELIVPSDPLRGGELLTVTAVIAVAMLYAGTLAGVRTQSDGISGVRLGMTAWLGSLVVYALLVAVRMSGDGHGFPASELGAWLSSGWMTDVKPAMVYFAACVVSGAVMGLVYRHRVLKPMHWSAAPAH